MPATSCSLAFMALANRALGTCVCRLLWPILRSYVLGSGRHSKRLEVVLVQSTNTEKTLEALRYLFTKQLVSDNGPQFVSNELC